MHVLIVHQAFAMISEPGGTRHHEMARYLTEQGYRLTVITSQVSYLTGGENHQKRKKVVDEIDDKGVRILRSYTYHGYHRSFLHRVISFISFTISSFFAGLKVQDVDLVWGTSPPIFQGLTTWALARLKGVPFLFEVRDLWPYFAIEVGVLSQPILIRLSQALEQFLYRHADQVVVNSPGYVNHVIKRGARAVEMIPNGVDVSMFPKDSRGSAFRDEHALDGKFVVLYAGAHGMSNDLEVILEAAQELGDEHDVAFVLLGDGKEKKGLIAKAESMGLQNVHFVQPVSKKEMPIALAAADACIAILKPIDAYKTTYPNKVFDYMAASKPVILVIDGVIRELVESAGAGVFVPPGDSKALAEAVCNLRADPDLCLRMGSAGREYVLQNFNRLDLTLQMSQVIKNLVDDAPSQRKPDKIVE